MAYNIVKKEEKTLSGYLTNGELQFELFRHYIEMRAYSKREQC